MASATSTAELHQRVTGWFRDNARALPWREPECSSWGIMVSEFMLQQTPVVRVLPVWQQWLKRWPTPAALAAASSGDAVRHWGRLGYPRRALRLHAAAGCLVEQHGGTVPASYDFLLALPGVGSYTAAAIASFAFNLPATVVDTNIRRVHARAVTGKALPASALTAAEMRLARELMPDDAASSTAGPTSASTRAWNASVMELGATVCTARSPKCELCPLLDVCAWVANGRPEPDYVPKGQSWTGTDRQVRGAILGVLRESTAVQRGLLLVAPVDLAFPAGSIPELDTGALGTDGLNMGAQNADALRKLHALNAPADQLERALAGLLSDGLAEASGDEIRLPV